MLSVFEKTFRFAIQPVCGVVALSREAGVNEVCFSALTVSAIKTEKKQLWEQSFSIPTTDGGSYPYDLKISMFKFGGKNPVYEISYALTGGVYNNEFDCKGFDCWTRDDDMFWGLYFALGTEKYYLCVHSKETS